MPVFTSVSQATRPVGSSRRTASSTPSEIWSAILSGWPSVTDSEGNRGALSGNCVEAIGANPSYSRRVSGVWGPAGGLEVDHQRHPLEGEALAQLVLEEVGV